jgi:phage shock protein A
LTLLGRLKRAISAKANDVIDKATDPQKEMDVVIAELDDQVREAKKELLGYKATEKQLAKDIDVVADKIAAWEKRAMDAVKSGNDELAKEALREKKRHEEERVGLLHDRNEAASYAIELNRSRKQVETKLQILKLKKSTMAQQIAAARAGGKVFGDDGDVWERMRQAEERIDDEAIASEVDELLGLEDGARRDALAALTQQTAHVEADVALAQLKARMKAKTGADKSAAAPAVAAPAEAKKLTE